jgi:ectoine utilization protein EutC
MFAIREEDIRLAVPMADAIDAVEQAFAAFARGEARLPDVIYMDFAEFDGDTHMKGAHLKGAPYFVCKVASGFYRNPEKGLPVGSGLVLVFDATTGIPQAILLDNGYLTDLRTGAAGAVAAKHLAHESLTKIAMIGAGLEARFQMRALTQVREVPVVFAWSRSPEHAEVFSKEMKAELGLDVRIADSVEDAVRKADLVITATPSRQPLVLADWISPGAHITALGSDGPDKQELDAQVLARADLVVADHLEQCAKKGEIHHAVDSGAMTLDDVTGELGGVIEGTVPGRTAADQITVCDLTGVGVQDAAVGSLAFERARAADVGSVLDL